MKIDLQAVLKFNINKSVIKQLQLKKINAIIIIINVILLIMKINVNLLLKLLLIKNVNFIINYAYYNQVVKDVIV